MLLLITIHRLLGKSRRLQMKQILARDMFIHARPTITKQYSIARRWFSQREEGDARQRRVK